MMIATTADRLPAGAIWGTDASSQTEARDWLTLARMLGWSARLAVVDGPTAPLDIPTATRCLVIACDPERLGPTVQEQIVAALQRAAMLVIGPGGAGDGWLGRLAGVEAERVLRRGGRLHWVGPGERRTWALQRLMTAEALCPSHGCEVWATLDGGAPLIAARRVGAGTVAVLGFDPSAARMAFPAVTALVKHLLIEGPRAPVAWLDLTAAVLPRMDDPGASAGIFLEDWAHPRLDEGGWRALAADLVARDARLSVGYVPGWLDDGSRRRGTLRVGGRRVRRSGGNVHPAPTVHYLDRAGHAPGRIHDHRSEFRGILALRAARAGDVELHGHTHVQDDGAAWATAPDRYTNVRWYQEFCADAEPALARRPPGEHPVAKGLGLIRRYFATTPTTLICPGQQWVPSVLDRALALGFELVAADGVALRDADRFCWVANVATEYLDKPSAAHFEAELPVVGYFHDREAALAGPGWVAHWLDRWTQAGARRFIDFRELAAALARPLALEQNGDGWAISFPPAVPVPPRAFPVRIRLRGTTIGEAITVHTQAGPVPAPVERLDDGTGRVAL